MVTLFMDYQKQKNKLQWMFRKASIYNHAQYALSFHFQAASVFGQDLEVEPTDCNTCTKRNNITNNSYTLQVVEKVVFVISISILQQKTSEVCINFLPWTYLL